MSKSTRNARTAQLFELVLIFLDSFNIISRNIFVCRLKFSLLKIIRKSLFWSSAQTPEQDTISHESYGDYATQMFHSSSSQQFIQEFIFGWALS